MLFVSINFVSAIDFSLSGEDVNPLEVYDGDTSTLTAIVTADPSNFCNIVCAWGVNTGPDYSGVVSGNSNLPKTVLASGVSKIFPFRINAVGQGSVSYTLTVTCDNENPFCLASPVIKTYSNTLTFDYAGDNECTTSKEKCVDYDSYTGTIDCACSSIKECNPSSFRGADDYGCATYCGNTVKETEFETCSNCPSDIGKCDGLSCVFSSECEGNFCVHEKCSSKPYIEGDGFCDLDEGENCKNSVSDCSCGNNERCGNAGMCETYCGNSICEASEKGICKLDCQWCGDGQCKGNENCKSCQTDCGVCESSELTKEISGNIQSGVEEGLKGASKRQRNITFTAIGLIVLFIGGYVIFKFMREKKSKTKKTTKKKTVVKKRTTKKKTTKKKGRK